MRLVIAIILVNALIVLTEATATSNSDLPPLKIDKNLRQALLKALEDLETESAEQKDSLTPEDLLKKLQEQPIEPEDSTTVPNIEDRHADDAFITFEKYPGDCTENDSKDEEDKLQNSSFETERVIVNDFTISKDQAPKLEKVVFQKYDNNQLNNNQPSSTIQKKISESESVEIEKIESKSFKNGILSNIIDDTPKHKSLSHEKDGLATSSSNGIASVNVLISPSPTAASLVAKNTSTQVLQSTTERLSSTESEKKDSSEVNIYPVPLVAAFTVQQDERGIAKSVVPIYKPNGLDALTLQEQLEFKQKLLEKQLAELQEQQYHQTQFLLRQQQLYQEQQRQKQQLYYQEQARLKLLEEQKYHQLKQQSLQSQVSPLQQQQQQQKLQQQQLSLQAQALSQQQLPLQAQSLPQPLALQAQTLSQQILPLQQQQQKQQLSVQQPLGAFSHHNPLSFQLPAKTSNVQFQPSLAFQLPNTITPPNFNQQIHLDRYKLPQAASHQSLLLQNQQTLPRLQTIPQEQKFQQTFEFQPSVATRFNRQEGHESVGNFGINDNRQLPSRNNAFLELPSRVPAQFVTPFNQYRHRPSPSAANQIQQLLYQSGVAGDFGKYQGNSNPEDLNIVSKVLALNVGAVPAKSINKDFFGRA
ncbi:bromodomain-containing protein DDB_G0280777-like [Chelonus insularis]|uniref:bromodomain-containing protein DDB_G0280777-like n=1 Tax=Chelonus insularis TaxID=460826 RepID=UPI00158EBAFB|nr:bromodomain-containing protein DDB_G0280777-like [Chelonus insularis]